MTCIRVTSSVTWAGTSSNGSVSMMRNAVSASPATDAVDASMAPLRNRSSGTPSLEAALGTRRRAPPAARDPGGRRRHRRQRDRLSAPAPPGRRRNASMRSSNSASTSTPPTRWAWRSASASSRISGSSRTPAAAAAANAGRCRSATCRGWLVRATRRHPKGRGRRASGSRRNRVGGDRRASPAAPTSCAGYGDLGRSEDPLGRILPQLMHAEAVSAVADRRHGTDEPGELCQQMSRRRRRWRHHACPEPSVIIASSPHRCAARRARRRSPPTGSHSPRSRSRANRVKPTSDGQPPRSGSSCCVPHRGEGADRGDLLGSERQVLALEVHDLAGLAQAGERERDGHTTGEHEVTVRWQGVQQPGDQALTR